MMFDNNTNNNTNNDYDNCDDKKNDNSSLENEHSFIYSLFTSY